MTKCRAVEQSCRQLLDVVGRTQRSRQRITGRVILVVSHAVRGLSKAGSRGSLASRSCAQKLGRLRSRTWGKDERLVEDRFGLESRAMTTLTDSVADQSRQVAVEVTSDGGRKRMIRK
jgi:hypothetical protein